MEVQCPLASTGAKCRQGGALSRWLGGGAKSACAHNGVEAVKSTHLTNNPNRKDVSKQENRFSLVFLLKIPPQNKVGKRIEIHSSKRDKHVEVEPPVPSPADAASVADAATAVVAADALVLI